MLRQLFQAAGAGDLSSAADALLRGGVLQHVKITTFPLSTLKRLHIPMECYKMVASVKRVSDMAQRDKGNQSSDDLLEEHKARVPREIHTCGKPGWNFRSSWRKTWMRKRMISLTMLLRVQKRQTKMSWMIGSRRTMKILMKC
jgi:hypothetical protein